MCTYVKLEVYVSLSGPDFKLAVLRARLTSSFVPSALRPCDQGKGDVTLCIALCTVHSASLWNCVLKTADTTSALDKEKRLLGVG